MVLTLLVGVSLSGCGQAGPLYMPDNPPESQKPRAQRTQPAQAAPTTAPAANTPASASTTPASSD